MDLITKISDALVNVRWTNRDGNGERQLQGVREAVSSFEDWPMRIELDTLFQGQEVGQHVSGVIANINELIDFTFKLYPCEDAGLNQDMEEKLRLLLRFCLAKQDRKHQNAVLRTEDDLKFAHKFLRVAALYHDIGKIIGNDRHVSRGVHLMRDVNDKDREAFEQKMMKGRFEDKHNFWTLLSHHDVFGCLCTGEAALPALSQIVSWAGDHSIVEPHKSPAAVLSYLLVLNIADVDSSLRFRLKGLRTIEANRYFDDWRTVLELLWDDVQSRPKEISRQTFKDALLQSAGQPKFTIDRLVRLVTTSFRMNMPSDALIDESEVKKLVEDELEMLHGARLQMFCYLFARFCKIDYGRRFFDVIMKFALLDKEHGLLERVDGTPDNENECPVTVGLVKIGDYASRRSACLKEMTRRVCSIIKRIVDDYGDSVAVDPRSAPLMSIVMANVMPQGDPKTAWPICRALREDESRALAWISEEVAVSPYAG